MPAAALLLGLAMLVARPAAGAQIRVRRGEHVGNVAARGGMPIGERQRIERCVYYTNRLGVAVE